MGDKINYYCLKCGHRLVDKPSGHCTSCQCPYDLNNNITYSLLPRPTDIEAIVVTALLTLLASIIYSVVGLNLAMLLPIEIGGPAIIIAGAILALFAWMTSLKLTRFISLIALTIGISWGPIIAAVITATIRDDFTRGMSIVDWLSIGSVLTVVWFIILYPTWAVRQIMLRRWRSNQTKNPA